MALYLPTVENIANEFFEYVPPSGGFLACWIDEDGLSMLLQRNTAGQVLGCQMVSATDGSAFTGTVSVAVTLNGGTQSAGSGSVVHEGNGYHSYTPTQAETNANVCAFTFTGTGAVPRTIQAHGVSFNPYDAASLGLSTLDAAVSTRLASASYSVPLDAAGVRAAVGLASANLDTQLSTLDTVVDAILADTGTTGVVVATNNDKTGYAIATGGIGSTAFAAGAINAAALSADAVDEILDEQIGDSTITLRQAMKIVVAALAGKVSGAGTASITIRNYADTTDIIVGAIDGAGNRTSTTVTV